MNRLRILITGANGMIGTKVIEYLLARGCEVVGLDKGEAKVNHSGYSHVMVDLSNQAELKARVQELKITHIVHMAALAHKIGETDLSWERYVLVNVTASENIFYIAAEQNIPILFSSTADVYGITDGEVDGNSERHPIGNYARSKCLAEDALKKICKDIPYTIMRFAPVYTPEIKRDIQKRYYLKYPNIAYRVGKGVEYEVLSIENLVKAVYNWIYNAGGQQTLNVKNAERLKTVDVIASERKDGRARIVIWVPRWIVSAAFRIFRVVSPNGWKTYMLNKIVNPLRTR